MTSGPDANPLRLHRDRTTWSLFLWFLTWGWVLYSFGPSVPLLGEELGVSDALAGLHGTAMAVGAVVAALLVARVVDRLGRRVTLTVAGLTVIAGLVLLLTGRSLVWTLLGVFVAALGGNVLLPAAQVALALHHGPAAPAAITEANGAGSGIGFFGPLAVGAAVALGWTWRPGVAVAIVIAVVAIVAVRRLGDEGRAMGRTSTERRPEPVERAPEPTERTPQPVAEIAGSGAAAEVGGATVAGEAGGAAGAAVLAGREDVDPSVRGRRRPTGGAAAWFYVVLVCVVAMEFATTFWATELVVSRTHAGAGIAAATTSGLVAGMTAIRFVVSPLSLRVRPVLLLAASFLVAVAGWAVLWTATSPMVAMAGLVIAGLGYGVHFPITISLLLATSAAGEDRTMARATLASGLAIGVAPFLLGAISDVAGTHTAFLAIPVLAVVGGTAALVAARRMRTATEPAAVAPAA